MTGCNLRRPEHDPLVLPSLLSSVLTPHERPAAPDDLASWWPSYRAITRDIELPIDRAIVGASLVDRLGYAFFGGYSEALRSLVANTPRDALLSFAATEEGGAHPRAIQCSLRREGSGWVLDGTKRWVTGAPLAESFLVVARERAPDGPLSVVRVSARASGVSIAELPATPFVPEIPHAEVTFQNVRIEDHDRLPGDGYDAYLKPFRTVEDLHVHAALLAWLLASGHRERWPRRLRERGLATLVATRSLALSDPRSPAIHVATGGVLDQTAALIEELEPCWQTADAELRARWERDRPLLQVASKVRSARLEKAWSILEP
jgi:hypothetical protein